MWFNVFYNISQNGKMTIWTKGRRYDSKAEAESYSHIGPDGNFHYIGTVNDFASIEAEVSHQ